MSTTRRPARAQKIPEDEVEYLATLSGFDLFTRCKMLYSAGWTLRAIGEALTPSKSRSTVHSWLAQSTLEPDFAAHMPPTPEPEYVTEEVYTPKIPSSPGISRNDLENIQALAPLARKFRSRMHPDHQVSQANQGLTLICQALHADGVSIQELADAAGVTYRAMAKRIGKS